MRVHECEAKVFTACSSRVADAKAGLWKNSYHMVIENLVFPNNHDGAMAAFWRNFIHTYESQAYCM